MRSRLPLLVVILALAFGSQAPLTQTAVEIPQAVVDAVEAEGSALVIVGVRAAFTPEGELSGPFEVAQQRDAMHGLVDGAMGRAAAAGAVVGHRFETIPFFTARVDAASLAALASMPDVVSIAANSLDRVSLNASVPLINAPATWAAGATGAGWSVAVLDTGIEKTHSFLAGKVLSEACYSNAGGLGSGASTCPGGVPATTAVNSGVACNAAVGGCDHGTHVAGIAAGANAPGGVNGVAPGAGLLAMQVFTYFSGTSNCGSPPNPNPCVAAYTSDQVLALERVLALAGAGNANRVASVNMSLGGGQFFSQESCDIANTSNGRKQAIDNLRSVGIATAIASGNNGFTSSMSAPGCISTAVSVGSTTKADAISSFSNRASFLSLMAPGSAITSSVIGNAFGSKNGTSMATPHVAGAWALLKQAMPAASVAQVLSALQSTGAIIPDGALTHRRINVNAARLALVGGGVALPGAPGTPVITGSGNTVQINWTAPISGGAPTGYTVVARLAGGGPVVATLPVGNVLGTQVVAPNGGFLVSVVATNASGAGPESPGATFAVPILPPPPGAPTGLAVNVGGTTATFTWTAPATGGLTTGYVLVAALSPGGAAAVTLPIAAPAAGIQVDNVPPGTYYVRVVATNAGGAGPFSNEVTVNVAGPQPPGVPTLQAPVVTGNNVTLSWSPAGTGGAPTGYNVIAAVSPGGAPVASFNTPATSANVPGVPSGTYYVSVRAFNALGPSGFSNEVTVVVP